MSGDAFGALAADCDLGAGVWRVVIKDCINVAGLPTLPSVRPFNLSGHPAITLPLRTAEGLPAGVQLVGRRGGDAALIAVAEAVFRSSPHFVSMQEN